MTEAQGYQVIATLFLICAILTGRDSERSYKWFFGAAMVIYAAGIIVAALNLVHIYAR